ncbi:MAG: hypothetical protein CMM52_03425 [Rhodospirillaceae bacterium]|nr:hypothetical protein [Rhodospirillaceae bacterium]|tara:strand:+ start:6265 stop:6777 length:513 start_codon:yes stop_codon:yes gene_type:complete
MPDKSVSLSVRLSSKDAAFLADYDAQGATSLSEKVRSIIAEARQRNAGNKSYDDSLYFAEGLIGPALHRLRELEAKQQMHSELLLALNHWLPDAMASLISGVPEKGGEDTADELVKLEAVMADRIFFLSEQILRLGVTGESPCYDPSVVNDRASTVVRLSQIIKDTCNKK